MSAAEWWTDPRLAYAQGLVDGARLERERIAAEDDALHRQAVRAARAHMDRVDRRRAADDASPRAGDFAGVRR